MIKSLIIIFKGMKVLFNYIKFAIYQFIGFLGTLPKLLKYKNNPGKYSSNEQFDVLKSHALKSLKLVDIDVNILGKEKIPNEPVLFVVNHSSMLDSFILISSVDRPIGCVIADEPIWKNIPILRDWTKLIKCVYINRKNNREGIKSIIQASKNITLGHSMAIFPEGDLTWVKEPNSLVSTFRSGALKIAYKANCPIVPLVIKNSQGIYDGYEPIGKIHSKSIEVEFLDPIYKHIDNTKLKSSILADHIKNKMEDKMLEFNYKEEKSMA